MKYEIDNITIDDHFSSSVFKIKKPEFLNIVNPVFKEYVSESKKYQGVNDVYPGVMTSLISEDSRIAPFVQYVSDLSWDILDKQGYDLSSLYTNAMDMWGQHHPYTSSMENHFHGAGSQLCGFYFLDTPSNSSSMLIQDPRAVKVYANLPAKETNLITHAHDRIFYTPEPGDLIFINSWLSHSFTRNESKQPYNFIHINVHVFDRADLNNASKPIVI